MSRAIVIAHRGASGYRPEHTLESYKLAIEMGADYIEPDLVMTRDGRLIARHDNVLDLTTDIAHHGDLAARRRTRRVDGAEVTGCFSEDFTLAEIQTLRARERIPATRPANAEHNGRYAIPTLEQIIELVKDHERRTGRVVGIYPETKHPTHFAELGLAMEEPLVRVLHEAGYRGRDAACFIQSFEVSNLRKLRAMTQVRLVQLLGAGGQPFDVTRAGGDVTYDRMGTGEGLKAIAGYADAVGPEKYRYICPRDDAGRLDAARATSFLRDAHAACLAVHPYTFRADNEFLPTNLRQNGSQFGDARSEIDLFLRLGIDGFFIDQPDIGVAARDAFLAAAAPRHP